MVRPEQRARAIKRERGANPRQSRCCEPPVTPCAILATDILIGKAAAGRGASQKTCHSTKAVATRGIGRSAKLFFNFIKYFKKR